MLQIYIKPFGYGIFLIVFLKSSFIFDNYAEVFTSNADSCYLTRKSFAAFSVICRADFMNTSLHSNTVWTIGHSTHTLEEFIAMLQAFQIELVADVRSFPGSRRYPHFNKEALQISLSKNNINYVHLADLGGRRKVNPNSINTGWRHPAFRGYADYMETESFKTGINELQQLANEQKTAYMCSEAVWWRCHRALVSDYLKLNGLKVTHIMGLAKSEEHRYTQPARIVHGKLTYQQESLF